MSTQKLIEKYDLEKLLSSEDVECINSAEAQKSFDLIWDCYVKEGFRVDQKGQQFLRYKQDGGGYWLWFDEKVKFHYETDGWRREKLDGRSYYTAEEIKAGLRDKKEK